MIFTPAPAYGLGFCAIILADPELQMADQSARSILLHHEKGLALEPTFETRQIEMWKGFSEGLTTYGLYMSAELRDRDLPNRYDWWQQARLKLRRHRGRYTRFPPMLQSDVFIQFCREWLVAHDADTYHPKLESFVPLEPFQYPEWPEASSDS